MSIASGEILLAPWVLDETLIRFVQGKGQLGLGRFGLDWETTFRSNPGPALGRFPGAHESH